MAGPARTWLRYDGVGYAPRYVIYSDKRLYRVLKSRAKLGADKGKLNIKLVKLHLKPDGYERWDVRNPVTGKRQWITASRAVQISFLPAVTQTKGLVAAHKHGRKRHEGSLDDCEFTTQRVNCAHKRRDGTHSTGHHTAPGKLCGKEQEIVRLYDTYRSISFVAEVMGVSRNAIAYQLKKRRQT